MHICLQQTCAAPCGCVGCLILTGLFHSRVDHWRIPLRPAPTPDSQFNFKLVCRFCCLYLLSLFKSTTRIEELTHSVNVIPFSAGGVGITSMYVQKRCYKIRTDRPHHTWLKFQAQFVGNINTGC